MGMLKLASIVHCFRRIFSGTSKICMKQRMFSGQLGQKWVASRADRHVHFRTALLISNTARFYTRVYLRIVELPNFFSLATLADSQ